MARDLIFLEDQEHWLHIEFYLGSVWLLRNFGKEHIESRFSTSLI